MTAWSMFLLAYASVSMFAWIIPGVYSKHARRNRQITRFHERISNGNDRWSRSAETLIAYSDRWERYNRLAAFLAANVMAAGASFMYAVLVGLNLEDQGREATGFHLASTIFMGIAAIAVSGLVAWRYRAGAARPFRELGRSGQVWLGTAFALALAAFMTFANAPV